MSKREIGILGVPRDRKKAVLFSYKGELCESDSEDSDYVPSDEEEDAPTRKKPHSSCTKVGNDADLKLVIKSPEIKRRRWKNGTSQSPGKTSPGKRKNGGHVDGCPSGLWGERLPPEVLQRIFQFAVADGALPLLSRLSRVCLLWSETSMQPSLWSRLDLSFGWVKFTDATLTWLAHNRLSKLHEINLSGWKSLTNAGLQVLSETCQDLRSVNISHCRKITADGLLALVNNCMQLQSLDISFLCLNTAAQNDALSLQTLTHLSQTRGSTLKSLNVSGNNLRQFDRVLTSISSCCPALEELDVSNCAFSSDFLAFNIERLQNGCPGLKIIRLNNSKFRASTASMRVQAESLGFPALEELGLAISTEGVNTGIGIGMNDAFLHRLLKKSRCLRLLDLRGSTLLTSHGLQCLPAENLQHLYLSQSSTAKYEGIETIVSKWQHSLVELDLSWNVYDPMSLDLAMRKLTDMTSLSPLRHLNLSGTCISCSRVKSLLEGCGHLDSINLVSCRGLPRGMKRQYQGDSLLELRNSIDGIIEEERRAGIT